jgi:hypothetical protein
MTYSSMKSSTQFSIVNLNLSCNPLGPSIIIKMVQIE